VVFMGIKCADLVSDPLPPI
jgi:hypothetical protein